MLGKKQYVYWDINPLFVLTIKKLTVVELR